MFPPGPDPKGPPCTEPRAPHHRVCHTPHYQRPLHAFGLTAGSACPAWVESLRLAVVDMRFLSGHSVVARCTMDAGACPSQDGVFRGRPSNRAPPARNTVSAQRHGGPGHLARLGTGSLVAMGRPHPLSGQAHRHECGNAHLHPFVLLPSAGGGSWSCQLNSAGAAPVSALLQQHVGGHGSDSPPARPRQAGRRRTKDVASTAVRAALGPHRASHLEGRSTGTGTSGSLLACSPPVPGRGRIGLTYQPSVD